MIRVGKNASAPQSLSTTKAYDGDDVKKQLKEDHNGKCYLCERVLYTDCTVEHHKSQENFPHLKQDWRNLFWACSYCNGRKSDLFDSVLDPSQTNIEDEIRHELDSIHKRVEFIATAEPTEEHIQTIELLNKLHNGKGKIRNFKEQEFFNYIHSKINDFLELVVNYLKESTPHNESLVRAELQIDQECLGFKYWIIKSNPLLERTFKNDIIWNKI